MINFHNENGFELKNPVVLEEWIVKTILTENRTLGEINYIFCDDEYLHKINMDFLNHDTYTDIISFDYTQGELISGDIYISTERVAENAEQFKTSFNNELKRVMVHGILHYCGYGDKTDEEQRLILRFEKNYLCGLLTLMFHVKQ